MSEHDDEYRGPKWLTPAEHQRIWNDLLTGPKPRAVDPELKASLLADVGPEEAELMRGLLEIVEQGPADIEGFLAELDRKLKGDNPSPQP